MRDYRAWHSAYDDPESSLSWRLQVVQGLLREALDRSKGPVRALSLCSGDGRDLIEVLASRTDAGRVRATLVELDPDIAAAARRSAERAGLAHIDVRTADAGTPDAYADVTPADLVLLVGIFGNISLDDLRHTIRVAGALCSPGATVLWSRGRRLGHGDGGSEGARAGSRDGIGDLSAEIRAWFVGAGFTELDFRTRDSGSYPALGVLRYAGPPRTLPAGEPLFTFIR